MANVEVFYWNISSSIELPFLKKYEIANQVVFFRKISEQKIM